MASPSASLRSIGLQGVPQRFPLAAEVVIGREPTCQIVLDSNQYGNVSRRHAVIRCAPDGTWRIMDLGSANGTYVNQQLCTTESPLKPGDHIRLGATGAEFVFELQQPPPPEVQIKPGLSMSQLLPIISTGKDLRRKAFLVPGALTVLLVMVMFAAQGNFGVYAWVLALYIGGGAYFFVYQLCGKAKPWWLLALIGVTTMGVLVSPVFDGIAFFFRHVLPGDAFGLIQGHPSFSTAILVKTLGNGFVSLFVVLFFGAGLTEELTKALPVFALCFLDRLPGPLRRRRNLAVQEPLDGILYGTASALGFTLVETMGQYVPQIIQNGGAGQLGGLELLIPRLLSAIFGHMAYSGYFGYFIGMSKLIPARAPVILLVGYGTSAALHALWDTTAFANLPFLSPVVGVVSYAFLAAAILKARAISPTRSANFATRIKP